MKGCIQTYFVIFYAFSCGLFSFAQDRPQTSHSDIEKILNENSTSAKWPSAPNPQSASDPKDNRRFSILLGMRMNRLREWNTNRAQEWSSSPFPESQTQEYKDLLKSNSCLADFIAEVEFALYNSPVTANSLQREYSNLADYFDKQTILLDISLLNEAHEDPTTSEAIGYSKIATEYHPFSLLEKELVQYGVKKCGFYIRLGIRVLLAPKNQERIFAGGPHSVNGTTGNPGFVNLGTNTPIDRQIAKAVNQSYRQALASWGSEQADLAKAATTELNTLQAARTEDEIEGWLSNLADANQRRRARAIFELLVHHPKGHRIPNYSLAFEHLKEWLELDQHIESIENKVDHDAIRSTVDWLVAEPTGPLISEFDAVMPFVDEWFRGKEHVGANLNPVLHRASMGKKTAHSVEQNPQPHEASGLIRMLFYVTQSKLGPKWQEKKATDLGERLASLNIPPWRNSDSLVQFADNSKWYYELFSCLRPQADSSDVLETTYWLLNTVRIPYIKYAIADLDEYKTNLQNRYSGSPKEFCQKLTDNDIWSGREMLDNVKSLRVDLPRILDQYSEEDLIALDGLFELMVNRLRGTRHNKNYGTKWAFRALLNSSLGKRTKENGNKINARNLAIKAFIESRVGVEAMGYKDVEQLVPLFESHSFLVGIDSTTTNIEGKMEPLITRFNKTYERNPLRPFDSFEHALNGLDPSQPLADKFLEIDFKPLLGGPDMILTPDDITGWKPGQTIEIR